MMQLDSDEVRDRPVDAMDTIDAAMEALADLIGEAKPEHMGNRTCAGIAVLIDLVRGKLKEVQGSVISRIGTGQTFRDAAE